jgi:alkylation response protein AidB-like acyl-CoA dehydrogenase
VRDFLATHAPTAVRGRPVRRDETLMPGGDVAGWRQAVVERGWIAPHWPREYGGAGLTLMEQFVLNEELARARVPHPSVGVGTSLTGPTLIVHGTEEQKAEHLSAILAGTAIWCQGFSEPGSGSDLASLQTRAVRDGDDYVVNGQKIWTSLAHRANRMILLARTNPEAPKHKGISFLLVPMDSPGLTFRPLPQMTGNADFNEVFFEDVRVPARNRVGPEGGGWYVATSTLDFERSSVFFSVGVVEAVKDLVAFAREKGPSPLPGAVRMELAARAVEAQTALLLSYRVIAMQAAGGIPNYEASIGKLLGSELHQRIARTGMALAGLHGQAHLRDVPAALAADGALAFNYLDTLSYTIAGGTSEVQRNVIATRGLGLPR